MSDTSERLRVRLADRYRIERELGAGGMATVYLAHDLRHDRDVAIKVLHPELGAALGGERFLSEIRTTARLQHPHILPLLDSGEADSLLYYVMPLVTGETLRARLERERQLPIADALRIAREVASALDYAHRQNVIHRDIKPENILLHDGSALVADFGIALAVQSAGGARMTQTGLSLGTPQYMSPEQAMGERTIDARSDIYALGALTYEMLAGDAPFIGSSVQAIVAKVLSEKPTALYTLRDTVPAHVERAVFTALAKLPADRFASAAEFAGALSGTSSGTFVARSSSTSSRPVWRDVRTWISVAAVSALLFGGVIASMRPAADVSTSRQHVVLWQHALQSPLDAATLVTASQAAIAPDGSNIVFSDSSPAGWILMRKVRGTATPVSMAGTEGGVSPFFSPDGKSLGFFTSDGRLRKVPAEGGGAITLAEDSHVDYRAGAWMDDGRIVYGASNDVFKVVAADGGTPTTLNLRGVYGDAFISMWPLPGSRGLLFTACPGNCTLGSAVYVLDFARDSVRLLVPQAIGAWYAPTGHLLYTARDGGLFAVPFDPQRLEITGSALSVIDDVEPSRFTLSSSGAALYSVNRSTQLPSSLMWVTRDGRAAPVDSNWRELFVYPAISPDGRNIAVSVQRKTTDLWIRRADGTVQQVITGGTASWRPSWTPDGTSLAFIAVQIAPGSRGSATVRLSRTDGGTSPLLEFPFNVWEAELSRDGTWLVFRADEKGSANIYARRLSGDTTIFPLLRDSTQTLGVALSPDSRWLAYVSNEAGGRHEVYIVSFPDMRVKRLVSRGGGMQPRWSGDGRELFFESGGQLVVLAIPPGPALAPGPPRPLFPLTGYRRARNRPQYDVAPDGQRFLMIREPTSTSSIVYAEHWLTELRAKVKR